jgi:hypothetical protein
MRSDEALLRKISKPRPRVIPHRGRSAAAQGAGNWDGAYTYRGDPRAARERICGAPNGTRHLLKRGAWPSLVRRGVSPESLDQTGSAVGRQVDMVRKDAERGELGFGPSRLRECHVRNVDIPKASLTD